MTRNSKMNRVLAVILALLITISSKAATMVFAAEESTVTSGTCGANVTWEYNPDNGTLTIGGTGAMADYYFMTSFDKEEAPWNAYKAQITTVTIENGVTHLGAYAFDHCKNLTTVTVPSSVVSMGEGVFYICEKLETLDFSSTTVKEIPKNAFNQCYLLKTVKFPNTLTTIGQDAFYYCNDLERLDLPASVKAIEDSAFKYTYGKWELHVMGDAPTLGKDVFLGSYGQYIEAPKVYVYGKDAKGYDIKGTVGDSTYVQPLWGGKIYYINQINSRNIELQTKFYNIGYGAPIVNGKAEPEVEVYDYTGEKLLTKDVDYTVSYKNNTEPSNMEDTDYDDRKYATVIVTGIGLYGGQGEAEFFALESGKCGDNATWIYEPINQELHITGSDSMYDYSEENPAPWAGKLLNYVIVEGVHTIGANAFANSTVLEGVYLNTPVTTIAAGAFSGCTNLTSVDISENAPTVAEDAFAGTAENLEISVYGLFAGGYEGAPWDALTIVYMNRIMEINITEENVKIEDKKTLEDMKGVLEQVLQNNETDYTDEEKQEIQDKLQQIGNMLDSIGKVENAKEGISKLPETMEPDDEEAIRRIANAKDVYDALTEYEKSMLDTSFKAKLENLLTQMVAYEFEKESGDAWAQSSNTPLSFIVNGAFSKFIGIEIDGKPVSTDWYNAAAGSTLIDLDADYLKTLALGKHTITVRYTDGSVTRTFIILSAATDKDEDKDKDTGKGEDKDKDKVASPATGDDRNSMLFLTLMIFSAAVAGIILSTSTRINEERKLK